MSDRTKRAILERAEYCGGRISAADFFTLSGGDDAILMAMLADGLVSPDGIPAREFETTERGRAMPA